MFCPIFILGFLVVIKCIGLKDESLIRKMASNSESKISFQGQRSTPFSVYILFISLLVRSLLVSLNLSLSLPVVFLLLLLLLARTNSIFNCLIVVLVHPKILHYGFPILTLNILGYNYRINNTYMKSFTFSPTFKIISLLFVIISKTNYNKKSFLIDLWL